VAITMPRILAGAGLVLVAATVAAGPSGDALASTVRYTHTWSPPLNLASDYRACCPSTAGFTTLPFTMNATASQGFNLAVRVRTNWKDTKAVGGTPNIIQQGRVAHPIEIKISVHSGPLPKDHHAQCRIEGSNGVIVNAQGPKSIDVADGGWHTIICVKLADTVGGTDVHVVVDGLAGPWFRVAPIGSIVSNDKVDLGGQGPIANKDSIDGQYQFVTYTVT
jgi:hypothetical protein